MYEIDIDINVIDACFGLDIYTKFKDNFVLYKKRGTPVDRDRFFRTVRSGGIRLFVSNEDMENYTNAKQVVYHNQLKQSISVDVEKSRMALNSLIQVALSHPRNGSLVKMREVIETLVDEYLSNPLIVIQLTQVGMHDYSTQLHLTNVMLYSIGYMSYCNRSRSEMKELGLAGLLHDIGKVDVPDHILQAPRDLSCDEFDVIKTHTIRGAITLFDLGMSEIVVNVALCHHERLDGSGYPNGKKGADIDEFSKIIAIIDCFEAIISWRPHRDASPPLAALKMLKEDVVNGKLDPVIFKDFANSIVGMQKLLEQKS